jgi:predicted amidohydrolase
MKVRIALAQMTSTRDVDANVAACEKLASQAADDGARWIVFPENAAFLGADREKLGVAEGLDGALMGRFRKIARDTSAYVTLSGFPEISPSADHTYNTLVVIRPDGELAAVYRKIHLFDAQVDAQTSYRESETVMAGTEVVSCELTFDHIRIHAGLTICYDLRFPELYRELRHRGANVLVVSSAFTLQTGRDHWHALLRARAIENQCYVLAPNQVGTHFGQRASYGHSSVYDPWGHLEACAPDRPCVVTADLDLSYLNMVRERMPVESHRRIGV